MHSFLFFFFDMELELVIVLAKIDSKDSFWRMVVKAGEDFNFAFIIPGDDPQKLATPMPLQIGWKIISAAFCTGTESRNIWAHSLLDKTKQTKELPEHELESKCLPAVLPASPLPRSDMPLQFLLRVHMVDCSEAAQSMLKPSPC